MKIPQIILVFLILASLLLAGCTDRKPKTSDSTADLPKPTITTGIPESSQPGSQETPAPETDSRTPESTAADTSAPTVPSDSTGESETEPIPATTSAPTVPSDSTGESETEPIPATTSAPTDPTESTETSGTEPYETAPGTEPAEPVTTEDLSGGIPVEEDPTIIASGDVELIGGD